MGSGTFNYTVTVKDSAGNTGKVNCSVTVNPPPTAACLNLTGLVQGGPFGSGPMTGSTSGPVRRRSPGCSGCPGASTARAR